MNIILYYLHCIPFISTIIADLISRFFEGCYDIVTHTVLDCNRSYQNRKLWQSEGRLISMHINDLLCDIYTDRTCYIIRSNGWPWPILGNYSIAQLFTEITETHRLIRHRFITYNYDQLSKHVLKLCNYNSVTYIIKINLRQYFEYIHLFYFMIIFQQNIKT